MTQKVALKLLLVLLLSSLVLLLLGFGLRRWKPELFPDLQVDPAEQRRSKLAQMDELPLTLEDYQQVQRNERGLYQWAEKSIIPDYHKVDLSIFKNRPKNTKALEGILVFIDAGEEVQLQLPQVSEASGNAMGLSLAATDPITGFPVSRDSYQKMETRAESMPDLPKEQILPNLAKLLKTKLEALGAQVVLTRELSQNGSDVAQAAVIALELCRSFVSELEEQKFKCSPVAELIPLLEQINKDTSTAATSELFTANGAGAKLHLLLDMERQYKDVLLLSLRLGNSKDKESGCKISYFSPGMASNIGTATLAADNLREQPAYIAYPGLARRRLAELMEKVIKGLLPDLSYQGRQGAIAEEIIPLDRLSNLNSIRIYPGFENQDNDLKSLGKQELQKSLAEAIAHACYQFYCE